MIIFKKLFLLLILISPLFVFSQQKKSVGSEVEQQKIRSFLDENTPWNTTKDSSAVYAFSFKVAVKKDVHGVAKVVSLIASDSIAYQVYPKYKFLETINYGVFMGNRKSADLIIPIELEVIDSKGRNIEKTDFLERTMSLLHLKPLEKGVIENYIYTEPHLVRMNKQIVD